MVSKLKFEFIFIKYDLINKNIRKYIFKIDLYFEINLNFKTQISQKMCGVNTHVLIPIENPKS